MSIPSLSSFSSTSSTPQTTLPINKSLVHPQNEECCLVAHTTSSTGYEPNVIDNFDYSETYTAIFQNDSVDMDTEPSYTFDAELDDELTRKALSSQLFTQEQEESAHLRQTYHSHEESSLPAHFFTRTSTVRPVHEPREELQKSHVLKVEELSRRKLIEDFEEVTSFFQESNVKTVYIIDDNDAKYPDAEIDDEHTRNSLASPLYLQEREASASLLQVYHSQRESLFQRAQSIFSKYGETRKLDVTKAQI